MFPPSNAPSGSSSDGHKSTMEGEPTLPILPSEPQQEQYQMWSNWAPPSLFIPLPMETFSNITTELTPFSNSESSTTAETTPAEIKTDPSDLSLVDLGMMMTGEFGMDEQWISFMRDSGLLQIDGNGRMYTLSPPTFMGPECVNQTPQLGF